MIQKNSSESDSSGYIYIYIIAGNLTPMDPSSLRPVQGCKGGHGGARESYRAQLNHLKTRGTAGEFYGSRAVQFAPRCT
jgi:hypothetical protein